MYSVLYNSCCTFKRCFFLAVPAAFTGLLHCFAPTLANWKILTENESDDDQKTLAMLTLVLCGGLIKLSWLSSAVVYECSLSYLLTYVFDEIGKFQFLGRDSFSCGGLYVLPDDSSSNVNKQVCKGIVIV